MSTYVMADIHGEIDRFHAMLDLINFSADDQLYIIGDVIDRGAEGVEILLEIIDKGNIHLILGNHEDMMLGTLSKDSFPETRRMWTENGGSKTRRDLLYRRTTAERGKILRYCHKRPAMETVEVNGTMWTLVHGRPSTKFLDMIWGRVEADDDFRQRTLYCRAHADLLFDQAIQRAVPHLPRQGIPLHRLRMREFDESIPPTGLFEAGRYG